MVATTTHPPELVTAITIENTAVKDLDVVTMGKR